MNQIYFNIPYTCQESADNIKKLIQHQSSINNSYFVNKCKEWFELQYPDYVAFMTTSCTRAMELISLSLNLSSSDEIILSPFTYVGVGNAFANYGAKLVYVDIDATTMNINADLIEASITNKTKAIIAMHYSSIPCDLQKIKSICDKYNLILIEDNAQGIQAIYNNKPLGSLGDFSCISFDTLKNISCNEGGVLLCKKKWIDKVDVSFNNGTNKTAYSKDKVSKYEWINKGSKFSMSEYTAAVLFPLLVKSGAIVNERKEIWNALYNKINHIEILQKYVPNVLIKNYHNAHLAYLKFDNLEQRNNVLEYLNKNGVPCYFHYVPLDDSIEGKRISKINNVCENSLRESNCLLRLPMHNFLTEEHQQKIANTLKAVVSFFER